MPGTRPRHYVRSRRTSPGGTSGPVQARGSCDSSTASSLVGFGLRLACGFVIRRHGLSLQAIPPRCVSRCSLSASAPASQRESRKPDGPELARPRQVARWGGGECPSATGAFNLNSIVVRTFSGQRASLPRRPCVLFEGRGGGLVLVGLSRGVRGAVRGFWCGVAVWWCSGVGVGGCACGANSPPG